MLKILQARIQQYVNPELPGVQAGFRKGRGTRNQIANIRWITKKGNAKECTNDYTTALISHASKAMLKIPRARLQMKHELPDVQGGFRKGRGARDQIANICWIIEKAREFQKNIYCCFIDYA